MSQNRQQDVDVTRLKFPAGLAVVVVVFFCGLVVNLLLQFASKTEMEKQRVDFANQVEASDKRSEKAAAQLTEAVKELKGEQADTRKEIAAVRDNTANTAAETRALGNVLASLQANLNGYVTRDYVDALKGKTDAEHAALTKEIAELHGEVSGLRARIDSALDGKPRKDPR